MKFYFIFFYVKEVLSNSTRTLLESLFEQKRQAFATFGIVSGATKQQFYTVYYAVYYKQNETPYARNQTKAAQISA